MHITASLCSPIGINNIGNQVYVNKKIRKSQHKLPSIHCQLSFRKKKTTSACYHLPSPTPPTPQMAIVLGVPPTNFLLLAKLLFLTQAQALLLWAFVQLLAVSSK